MADLQKSFHKFHDAIALDHELESLREKRDRVLARLFSQLERRNPRRRDQGSYALGTGIKPLPDRGDYDIDVALEFELDPQTISAVALKQEVFDAVKAHTQNVEVREPCVTIHYHRRGEPYLHVDLAVYAVHGGRTFLARGKPGAGAADNRWEPADPKALIEFVGSHPADPDHRQQQRRVIRYLKRWKDIVFSSEGEAAPRGIALTACTLEWFGARELEIDALTDVVAAMHQQGPQIEVYLPVPPGNGLFKRMSQDQRENYHARLGDLLDALRSAKAETNARRAAEALQKYLGEDFPVPKSAGPAMGAAAIGTSGASA